MGVWVRSHLVALWGKKVMMNSCPLSEMFFLRRVVESRAKKCLNEEKLLP